MDSMCEGNTPPLEETVIQTVNPGINQANHVLGTGRICLASVLSRIQAAPDQFPGRVAAGRVSKVSARPRASRWRCRCVPENEIAARPKPPPSNGRASVVPRNKRLINPPPGQRRSVRNGTNDLEDWRTAIYFRVHCFGVASNYSRIDTALDTLPNST